MIIFGLLIDTDKIWPMNLANVSFYWQGLSQGKKKKKKKKWKKLKWPYLLNQAEYYDSFSGTSW